MLIPYIVTFVKQKLIVQRMKYLKVGLNKSPFVCTATSPWDASKGVPVIHPDAVYLGDSDYGNYEKYLCPYGRKRFNIELAQ